MRVQGLDFKGLGLSLSLSPRLGLRAGSSRPGRTDLASGELRRDISEQLKTCHSLPSPPSQAMTHTHTCTLKNPCIHTCVCVCVYIYTIQTYTNKCLIRRGRRFQAFRSGGSRSLGGYSRVVTHPLPIWGRVGRLPISLLFFLGGGGGGGQSGRGEGAPTPRGGGGGGEGGEGGGVGEGGEWLRGAASLPLQAPIPLPRRLRVSDKITYHLPAYLPTFPAG